MCSKRNQQKKFFRLKKKNIYKEWQLDELLLGIKHNIDFHRYADQSYNNLQMREIRLGLEEGIDVSAYANPNIHYIEMKEMRNKLRRK